MNNTSFVRKLKKLGACEEAVEWVREHGGTSAECWRDCERGDWMTWLAAKTKSITKRQLVGALADIAALSLKYYEAKYPDDKRVRKCIDTCRRYAKGEATEQELKAASAAASAAACAASAAASAANAYYAVSSYAADAAAVRASSLKKSANIMRKHFPELLA